MKSNNLSKLGKTLLEMELSSNPFNEPILSVDISNDRFDLRKTFSPEERVISLENKFYKTTRFFCWGGIIGLRFLSFEESQDFCEAIAKIDCGEITELGIMPSHLVKKTIVTYGRESLDWTKSDTVCYEIYYLHPDQRDQIRYTIVSNANPMTFETEEEFTFNHGYFPEKGIIGGPK